MTVVGGDEKVRVLVVDDEPNIVDVISMALRFEGFDVLAAGTGADAIAAVAAERPQLLVLDVMLPDIDGFEVARRLANAGTDVPIVFLTARDSTEDIVHGLTIGGDDYVTKPFSLEELVARIRTILRRSGLREEESSTLSFADLELDEDTHEVARGERPIELTATEFRLLRYLLLNPRRVLTRSQILDHVWNYDFGGDARVLETYISYLRKKVDLDGPPLIHTVRGVGYALRLPQGLSTAVSLRARLLVGLIVVTAAGLVIAGVLTYEAERSFLVSRVDAQFNRAAINGFEDYVDARLHLHKGPAVDEREPGFPGGPPGPHGGPGGTLTNLPNGTIGIYVAANGSQSAPVESGVTGASSPKVDVAEIPVSSVARPRLVTADSRAGASLQYRVMRKTSDTHRGWLVIAVPLSDLSRTLTRLRNVELIVIAGVLLVLAGFAWLLIRLGLRPLDRIAATAGAIAAGDLSRRVTPTDPRTEVGRLGLALNAMLGQIERAFGEQQASEDRLRRFLSDASHELRTPLTSIRGYAEVFRMGAAASAEDTARAMARIEEEAARMGVLVEDLLALARLDEMPETTHEPLDLAPLLEDAAADTRAAARDRLVTVSLHGAHTVLGDAAQLRQVLANLMRNALTHTPPGSSIELTAADRGAVVEVTVRDHGPGLPDGPTASIFERFWRSEPGRERGRAGAGLGLAIVAAIVDAHGGRVSASNAPDGGAQFTIELPAVVTPPR